VTICLFSPWKYSYLLKFVLTQQSLQPKLSQMCVHILKRLCNGLKQWTNIS